MKNRCSWCLGDPLLIKYHDEEWGIPPKSDDELFERMAMQIFQAGLNWKIILQKRSNFRRAFEDFVIDKVATFDQKKYEQILNDAGIIRNRSKIQAVIENASILKNLGKEHGSTLTYFQKLPDNLDLIRKEMRHTFKFMGPEITRMFVFNIGKIPPPHESHCWRNREKSTG